MVFLYSVLWSWTLYLLSAYGSKPIQRRAINCRAALSSLVRLSRTNIWRIFWNENHSPKILSKTDPWLQGSFHIACIETWWCTFNACYITTHFHFRPKKSLIQTLMRRKRCFQSQGSLEHRRTPTPFQTERWSAIVELIDSIKTKKHDHYKICSAVQKQ